MRGTDASVRQLWSGPVRGLLPAVKASVGRGNKATVISRVMSYLAELPAHFWEQLDCQLLPALLVYDQVDYAVGSAACTRKWNQLRVQNWGRCMALPAAHCAVQSRQAGCRAAAMATNASHAHGPWLDTIGQGSEINLQGRVLTDVLAKDKILVEAAAHTKREAVSSSCEYKLHSLLHQR